MTQHLISEEVKFTLEVKKSQFISWLKTVESREEAMAYLQQARDEYPDARHHCWAYLIGNNPNSQTAAMSDDGEPSGTAGKPMLNVLQHKPVSNVMAIVIRYFGGIKLGAGGLVRAYSQAVEQSFGLANLVEIVPKRQGRVTIDFSQEQWLRHQLGLLSGEITNLDYQQQVHAELELPEQNWSQLQQILNTRSIVLKNTDE